MRETLLGVPPYKYPASLNYNRLAGVVVKGGSCFFIAFGSGSIFRTGFSDQKVSG